MNKFDSLGKNNEKDRFSNFQRDNMDSLNVMAFYFKSRIKGYSIINKVYIINIKILQWKMKLVK